MLLVYRILCTVALAGLVACSPGSEDAAAPTPVADQKPRDVKPTWREDRVALGEETYRAACASCHDSGEQDAPITGIRDQWEDRSDMWQAVLFKHAKSGYLEMPGKGGQSDLTDEAGEAATEDMLGLTFPDRLMD